MLPLPEHAGAGVEQTDTAPVPAASPTTFFLLEDNGTAPVPAASPTLRPSEFDNASAEQANMAPAPVATSTDPPQFNFPIPRELRDLVYEYLLDAKHVQGPAYAERHGIKFLDDFDETSRYLSVAHTYDFQANVLGVNKAIRQEAGETLFKQNKFVVVSWKWPQIDEVIHRFDIPMVSQNEKAIAHFVMDCMQLSIHSPLAPGEWNWRSALLLLKDLSTFCRMVRWMGHQKPWPAAIYVRKQGGIATLEHRSLPDHVRVHTQVQFRSNPFFTFKPECFKHPDLPKEGVMGDIMSALSEMLIPTQKFSSTCSPEVLTSNARKQWQAAVQSLMGGPEVWLSRLTVVAIESIFSQRRIPDRLVSEGKYEAAITRYCLILDGFARMQVFVGPHLSAIASPALTALLKALFQLVLDVAATAGLLMCRQLETASMRFGQSVHNVIHEVYIKLCDLPDCVEMHPYGSMRWFAESEASRVLSMCRLINTREAATLDETQRGLELLLEHTHGNHASREYIWHDLRMIQFLKNDERINSDYLTRIMDEGTLVSGLSMAAMPPQVFGSSIPPAVVAVMPTKFWGLMDLDRGVPGSHQG